MTPAWCRPKPVRTGPRLDGYRVIRDGLTGNETIVVNGLMRAQARRQGEGRDGDACRPKAETAGLPQ